MTKPTKSRPEARKPRPEPPKPVYTSVEDWVLDYFVPMFRRNRSSGISGLVSAAMIFSHRARAYRASRPSSG